VLLYNTGARVSEIVGIRRTDIRLESTPSVQLTRKGRKHRVVPVWKSTAKHLREWLTQIGPAADAPVFPNRNGKSMSRSGAERRLRRAVGIAANRCATLRSKRLSPHRFRHTTAMHLLQAGVDITVIAL
jgi:integrase/recombinase XerD